MQKKILFLISLLYFSFVGHAQTASNGIRYQAIARDATGDPLTNQFISLKVAILSGTLLEWEETGTVKTDADGLFVYIIGTGVSTGNGSSSSYAAINWPAALHYLKLEVNYGSGYLAMGQTLMASVPYAINALKTDHINAIYLDNLSDVTATAPSIGYLLKWNGTQWIAATDSDSDTVKFAFTVDHAAIVDSSKNSTYTSETKDTVTYSHTAGSSAKAITSTNTINAFHTVYSDTAQYALSGGSASNWSPSGNIGSPTKFLGSKTVADMILKTTNVERIRITADGHTGVGNAAPLASLHVNGMDGFLVTGTVGTGVIPDSATGTRFMFYPRKAAVCMGQTTANYWGDSKIGNYSFSHGLNCRATGIQCIALGINCEALAENYVSIGRNCHGAMNSTSNGGGGTVAMGDSVFCPMTRTVGIGRNIYCEYGVAVGYRLSCTGGGNSVYGSYNINNASYSFVFGTRGTSNAKISCFLYSDASSPAMLKNTQNNQFMVRASGGTIFYSDTNATVGVKLFPGSGSWSILSDRNRKANITTVDDQQLLKALLKMKIKTWSYETQDQQIIHLGPFAQDFYDAFHLGESKTSINTVDINGITLQGIKIVEKQTAEIQQKVLKLEDDFQAASELKTEMQQLELRLKELEKLGKLN